MDTNLITFLGVAVFIISYAAIAVEHSLKVSKSAIALIAGSILWILVAVSGHDFQSELSHSGYEIFSIVIFLLAAMSLIEILVHYRLFDVIRGRLLAYKLSERGQFLLITFIAFWLSAVIDNLTTTIIMIQISRRFFKGDNMLYAASAIVIAANAGGAFSPIGDVTTIMLWFAGKFSALEVIIKGILPSLAIYLVAISLMAPKIKPSGFDEDTEVITRLSRSEKLVVGLTFASFGLPLAMSYMGLPPFLGLLLGLGLVWLIIDSLKRISKRETHLEADIEAFIKKVDIPSLKFFVGILLAVSALNALGILEQMAHYIYGETASNLRMIAGNVGLGFLSAILDNVPLTAIAIQILKTTDSGMWVLLALTAGTGGSMLVIGSAAGVVAMGMIKELTFTRYIKLAAFPAFAGFIAGVTVWAAQTYLL